MSQPRPKRPWRFRALIAAALLPLAASLALVAAPNASAQTTSVADYAFSNGGGVALRTDNGASIVQITANHGDINISDKQPALSPDGTQVAFVRHDYTDNVDHTEIYVAPAVEDATATQVTHFGGSVSRPTWSPDSTQLAFGGMNSATMAPGLYRIHPDGTAATRVVSGDSNWNPAWCRNGRLAFAGDNADHSYHDIYVVNASDGGNRVQLTSGGSSTDSPAWTPDCRYVLYDAITPGALPQAGSTFIPTYIWAVPATGGASVQLTGARDAGETEGRDLEPSVSSDWTLAYQHQETSGDFRHEVYLQPLNNNIATRVPSTGSNDHNESPTFAPGDGSIPAPTSFPVAFGSTPNPTPSTSPTPPSANCPTLQVFGVRGSRGSTRDTGTSDSEMNSIFEFVTHNVTGSRATAIKYDAIPVDIAHLLGSYGPRYVDSEAGGEKSLRKALKNFWSTCATTRIILAGYSQGAQVAGTVVETLTAQQRTHITLLLFGDPLFNPKQSKVNVAATGYDAKLSGSFQLITKQMHVVPANLVANTRSYCLAGDPVCNLSAKNVAKCAIKCPHLRYKTEGWTTRAAQWAIDH